MGMAGGPGGGSDPGNSGGGSSGPGGGTGGGGGRGRGTMGPGGGSDPGNKGSTGGNSGGGTGGGSDGRGNNTPGHPGNPGRRGNSAPGGGTGGGRGTNTPGSPASRARDAMSRHSRNQSERGAQRQGIADTAKMGEGGTLVGDNDANAGLGVANAMDAQQTENSLNRAGVTDTIGMDSAERLGRAVNAGAALSQTERQEARGIVAGHRNQFSANRFGDALGAIPGAGLVTDAMAKHSRPKNTMQTHYNEGRKRANDTEMGALSKTVAGVGLGELGVTAPIGAVNTAQAIARDRFQNDDVASLRDAGFGDQSAPSSLSSGVSGGTASTAKAAMAPKSGMPGQPQGRAFGWSPVDIARYSRGPQSLARNS